MSDAERIAKLERDRDELLAALTALFETRDREEMTQLSAFISNKSCLYSDKELKAMDAAARAASKAEQRARALIAKHAGKS